MKESTKKGYLQIEKFKKILYDYPIVTCVGEIRMIRVVLEPHRSTVAIYGFWVPHKHKVFSFSL